MTNKSIETGVNVCDRTTRYYLNEMGCTKTKVKQKKAVFSEKRKK